MTEFAARIGRVRMKNGGADVRVLPQKARPFEDKEDYRGALLRSARSIVERVTVEKPLAGFLVLGIFDDSTVSLGYRYNFESRNAIPRMLLPAWLAEVLRRDLITEGEARDVFNEMFEWRDA